MVRGNPLPPLKVLKYAADIASGMAHLHSLNMIHRLHQALKRIII